MDIDNLKIGDNILIKLEDEKLIKIFEYLNLRIVAYENLFQSYLNTDDKNTKEFNLKKFLDEYVDVFSKIDNVKKLIFIQALGEKNYNFINDNFIFNYDINSNKKIVSMSLISEKGVC